MSLKASYWWQMRDHKTAIWIYYFVVVCVVMVVVISSKGLDSSKTWMEGFDLISINFLLVVGLCSFKENFGMLIQNGMSRKTIFIGRIMTAVSIAFGMAVVDRIFLNLCNLLFSRNGNPFMSDLYAAFYSTKIGNISGLERLIGGFLVSFCLYLCIITLGYIITLLFYRLGKGGKIGVGVGVPVTFNIILPLANATLFEGKLGRMITRFIDFTFGITEVKPQNLMISSLLLVVIVSTLSWMLMRKAILKKGA